MDYGSIEVVRALANLTDNDISDEDLSVLLQIAQKMFFGDVLIYVDKEEITYNRTTQNSPIYALKYSPIASPENGLNPTASDVKVTAVNILANDLATAVREIQVANINAYLGLIQLAESPTASEKLFASYYAAPVSFKPTDIDTAINFLAAHLATLRLEDPGTLAIADFNNALVVKDKEHRTRFLEMYERKKAEMLAGATFMGANI